jgi:hypothetical protein
MVGVIMANKKNVALLNEKNQLVNHIVLDIDDAEATQVMFKEWGAVRWVETQEDHSIIISDDPNIWAVWSDETKTFSIVGLPEPTLTFEPADDYVENLSPTVTVEGVEYPIDSGVFFENADTHPSKGEGARYYLKDYWP